MAKVTDKYSIDEIFEEASRKEASDILIHNGVAYFMIQNQVHSSESGFEKSKILANHSESIILDLLTDEQKDELSERGVIRLTHQNEEDSFRVIIDRHYKDSSLSLTSNRCKTSMS